MNRFYSEELKTVSKILATFNQNFSLLDDLLVLTNNFHKLIRILAFIFRFIYNAKKPEGKRVGPLELEEILKSENFLILQGQKKFFKEELKELMCCRKGI